MAERDEQELRTAAEAFYESLRAKLAASREGLRLEDLTTRSWAEDEPTLGEPDEPREPR